MNVKEGLRKYWIWLFLAVLVLFYFAFPTPEQKIAPPAEPNNITVTSPFDNINSTQSIFQQSWTFVHNSGAVVWPSSPIGGMFVIFAAIYFLWKTLKFFGAISDRFFNKENR